MSSLNKQTTTKEISEMSFVDWKGIASVRAAKHYAVSVVCGHWQEHF